MHTFGRDIVLTFVAFSICIWEGAGNGCTVCEGLQYFGS